MDIRQSAFSGLRYDAAAQSVDQRQSVGPCSYVLGTPVPHCSPCFQNDVRINNGTSGGSVCRQVSLIDVDSELQGLTRRLTRSPDGKYHPTPPCSGTAMHHEPECATRSLPVEDTRLNNPPCTLRCTGWNRWEWLCTDPQERALVPFDCMIDTSLLVKDNHRPLVPAPIDPTLTLPPGKNDPPHKGAPDWLPKCQPEFESPSPTVHWRSCGELDRIQHGYSCASSKA